MNNNEHWKFFVPGWMPEAIAKDNNVCLLKETVRHNMDKQKEELFKIIDNAVNLKLKGKTITEWEETAEHFRNVADRRLDEIERQHKIIVERGAKLNRQGHEMANIKLQGKTIAEWKEAAEYFSDANGESRESANRRLLEIRNLFVRIQQVEKEKRRLQTDNDKLRMEVSELNQKLDSLQAAYHEKDMELRELRANKEPADWSLPTFVEAVIQRKLTGMEKELLEASEALRAMKEDS